jgi:hypothetical protein
MAANGGILAALPAARRLTANRELVSRLDRARAAQDVAAAIGAIAFLA